MSEVYQAPKRRKTIDSYFKPREGHITKVNAPTTSSIVDEQPPPKSSRIDEERVEDGEACMQLVRLSEIVDATSFQRDPGLRLQISQHPVDKQDEVRRAYLNAGPYQPILQDYPKTKFGKKLRRFQSSWFTRFPWLEYSPAKDAAFCLPCFIFGKTSLNRTTFTVQGFRRWKRVNDGKRCAFLTHMGDNGSLHMSAVEACQNFAPCAFNVAYEQPPLRSIRIDKGRVEDGDYVTLPVGLSEKVDATSFERDPGLRLQIRQHPVDKQDEVRRAYLKAGPYQPILQDYPQTKCGKKLRRFQSSWFTRFPWLEYSPAKDAAFCLPCFIFGKTSLNRTTFTVQGFRRWKRVNDGKKCALITHMGDNGSLHMSAVEACKNLGDTSRHIDKLINVQSVDMVKNSVKTEDNNRMIVLISEQQHEY